MDPIEEAVVWSETPLTLQFIHEDSTLWGRILDYPGAPIGSGLSIPGTDLDSIRTLLQQTFVALHQSNPALLESYRTP